MDKYIHAVARAILKADGQDYGKIDHLEWGSALRKAKLAIAAHEASAWRPIEEAPVGEDILVNGNYGATIAKCNNAHEAWSGDWDYNENATHYMPLPTPPSNEGE